MTKNVSIFEVNKDQIFDMLDQCIIYGKSDRRRRLTVFFQNSYEDQRYTVLFFYVEGSPPKGFGWIRRTRGGLQLSLCWGSASAKNFWFNESFLKVTKYKLEKTGCLYFWDSNLTYTESNPTALA